MRSVMFLLIVLTIAFCLSAQAALPEGVAKPNVNQQALDKLGWKLGCQAYTFRAMSLFETLDLMHDLGMHYVEMYPGQKLSKESSTRVGPKMSQDEVDALIAKAKETEVTLESFGVCDMGKDEKSAREVLDWAKKIGLPQVVSEPPVDRLADLDKLCQEYGIKLAIHDHPKPSLYWNCDFELKALEGKSNSIGSCADIGHWTRSGLSSPECVKKLEGKIIELHMKDVNEPEVKAHDMVWGSGVVGVGEILVELKRQGFKGAFFTEYESTKGAELIGNVAKCMQWFSDQATKLAEEK
ncbi:MAG TPA: sugar phosphate isomerase/epimerase [Tepidisphaeraceae bacterium]|nr:sugar phosphate isomerase/epimerase [Tepidisphaeraceae bacterium]